MKKLALATAVVFLILLDGGIAQVQPETDVYVVQKGDVLYTLENNYSGRPWQWSRLMELNPFLKDQGRTWVDKKNRVIVLIKPGEELRGLKELGIIPNLLPLGQLKSAMPPASDKTQPANQSWWLLVIGAIAIAFVAYMEYWRMRRNPITAGPAMVPGGVTGETVASQFRINSVWPATITPNDRIEVKNITKGFLSGLVTVKYGDNSCHHRILIREIGYRGMVRRNDEPWSEEYMLQGCGNDLRSSGIQYIPGFAFRFVPIEVEVIEENSQPAANNKMQTATRTEIPKQETVADEGEKHFTFKPADEKGRPNFVQFGGYETFEVEIKENRTTVRFN